MKATFAAAAAAALAGSATAGTLHHRHAHDVFHGLERKNPTNGTTNGTECGCTTIYSTFYGEPTLAPPPPPPATTSAASSSSIVSTTTEVAPTTYETTVVVVPTPIPHYPTTTGVVTYPATTVVLTESTTVCVPETTSVSSGENTIGGVTTVVTTATTVTCPYATVETSEGVTTSVVKTTEYVCPSGGTYTIAPTTTYVDVPTTIIVPSVTTYPPGTYTQPEVVTTITDTKTVVYCPFEPITSSSAEPSTTSIVAPSSIVESFTSAYPTTTAEPTTVEPTTVEPTTAYPTTSVETTTAEPEPTTAYSTSSSPKPTGSLGGEAGVPWGTTYTPYDSKTGDCMAKEKVDEEIAGLAAAGVKIVRTYSTDCHTLEYVGGACEKHGIQMIVGVFIDSASCTASDSKIAEQISALKAWAKWDLVPLVVVGNEAALNGFCTPKQLADLITVVKGEFEGYTGLYTTAETTNIWQQDDAITHLCPAVDVIGTNAHAFFNLETTASGAGAFVKGQLDLVSGLCDDKAGIILETGWPSKGVSKGKGIASVAEQAIAIASIVKECGDKSILLSLHDDMWKSGNTDCGDCEQGWGISKVLDLVL